MSSSTFMSPNQQPGVPSRVCHLVGAISGGRFYVPLFRARATHHITSNPTSRPRSQEEKQTITRSCEYKCKPQFGPDIPNQLHASARQKEMEKVSGTRQTGLRAAPGNAWTHLYTQNKSDKCQEPRLWNTRIHMQPALSDTPRGNQATDEGEPRCLTSSGWTKFGITIYAIL